MRIEQCFQAAYLTTGVPAHRHDDLLQHSLELAQQKEDSSSGSTQDLPAAMNPHSLHTLPPLQLPVNNLRSGADMADQQWTRRQFSVLWAPMPAEYQLGDEQSAPGTGHKVNDGPYHTTE